MARPYRIKELEREHGDLHCVIPKLVNELGQSGAAHELGVSQATISQWLRLNGYVKREKWVRGATTYKTALLKGGQPEQA